MTELEKACEKEFLKYKTKLKNIDHHVKVSSHDFINGFNNSLKPEYMKHTEEVKELIEVIKGSLGIKDLWTFPDDVSPDMADEAVALRSMMFNFEQALKPFEKEGAE